ncbi:MAG: zinc-dependent metalloprotease family protein [Kiritimatiellia bacterium]
MHRTTFLLLVASMLSAHAAPPPNLGGRPDFQPAELPAGRLRREIEALPAENQGEAGRALRSFSFPEHDCNALHCGKGGGLYYACEFQAVNAAGDVAVAAAPVTAAAAVPVSPFPAALQFESKPGSANVLFLDFDGHVITGTDWNITLARDPFTALAFSTDADYTTYSDAEQAAIKRIWQRVAEDYAPFDINVTTKLPATFNTRTIRCLVTGSADSTGLAMPSSTAGGVAYVSVFATSSMAYYSPAFVYHNNLSNVESYIAEACSHECGHNLGLSHDGTSTLAYYGGHGSGDTSWGPIMGTGYGRSVSQWCKGEYLDANNTQDDLAIISGKITYRADDCGGTQATASYLTVGSDGSVAVTTPETDPANATPANKGRLERNTDVDMWAFTTGAGTITLNIKPWVSPVTPKGGNIDVRARLLDSTGAVVADVNNAALTDATITATVPAGMFYLEITNVAVGTPQASPPTGYTVYGGVGQYFISGTLLPAGGVVIPPQASGTFTGITTTGVGNKTLQVTYTDNVAINTSTLGAGDIRVTGPLGYSQTGTFVSVDNAANGTPRIATYSVPPPSGTTWTDAHNGVYTVEVLAGAVADVESAFVAPVILGTFTVNVPRRLYFAGMDTNPGWTLDTGWQYGAAVGTTGGDPAAGYTGANVTGFVIGGNYTSNLAVKYATAPPVDCSGATSVTLQFRRWLGLRSSDTASVQVSVNGTTWTDVWRTTSTVTDTSWQLLQYDLSAVAAGQSAVRVRWGLATNNRNNSYGWSLDDVEVLGNGAPVDTQAPTAALSALAVTTAGGPVYEFNVTYSDNRAVAVAGIDDLDIYVLGPNAYSNDCTRTGLDETTDGTPRVATYQCPAAGGSWDPGDNGSYQVFLRDGEVSDTSGNSAPGGLLGTFCVDPHAQPAAHRVRHARGVGDGESGGRVLSGRRAGERDGDSRDLLPLRPVAGWQHRDQQPRDRGDERRHGPASRS